MDATSQRNWRAGGVNPPVELDRGLTPPARPCSDGPDGDGAVVAAEAETVGNRPAHSRLPGRVRHVVEITGRVGRLVVDGRVDHAALDRQGRRDQLDTARGAEQVAD